MFHVKHLYFHNLFLDKIIEGFCKKKAKYILNDIIGGVIRK